MSRSLAAASESAESTLNAKRLKKLEDSLEHVKKGIKDLEIKVDGTASYDRLHKHPGFQCANSADAGDTDKAVIPAAEPALSLQVPKEFFVLWERYLNLCKALNKTPNSLIVELNQQVVGASLNCQSSTLTKRIKTEFSRFVAKYKNMGGAKRKVEASKNTNIVIFKSELKLSEENSAVKQLSLSKICTYTISLVVVWF